ncbi:hypothetical protein [Streptomyces sp. NPDC012888]|uniref:hypothetical protein n=1 Tax=Streptomyces sp. NPDC012888 TaxID=3364855 RepID=UPI0036C0604F
MSISPYVRSSRSSRSPRKARSAAVLLSLAALAGCGGQPADGAAGSAPTAAPAAAAATTHAVAAAPTTRFTENGVTVTLTVSGWQGSRGTLTAVFTPEEEGFHLYSTDLPAGGVEGVGRPTTVAVRGALAAEGRLRAAAPVRSVSLPGVGAPVPVYPDGPVTTTLAVRAGGDGDATVLLGYASCSEREGCTIPVSDRPVRLRVTAGRPVFTTS